MRKAITAAAFGAVLAACPGPDVSGPTLSTATAGDLCRSVFTVLGDRFAVCREATQAAASGLVSNARQMCDIVQASQDAGRLVYDPAVGAACLAAYRAQSCGEVAAGITPAACAGVYGGGTVANGNACTMWNDCAAGWCDASAAVCPGACVAWLAENAGCSAGGECAPGLVCNGSTCVPATPAGASGAPCGTGDLACQVGLYCQSSTGACQPLGGVGAACSLSRECQPGLGCAGSGTCQTVLDANAACSSPGAVCIVGTTCNGSICVAWPVAGGSCASGLPCIGSWCDGTTCQAFLAPGATCSADAQCGVLASCSGTCTRDQCL